MIVGFSQSMDNRSNGSGLSVYSIWTVVLRFSRSVCGSNPETTNKKRASSRARDDLPSIGLIDGVTCQTFSR